MPQELAKAEKESRGRSWITAREKMASRRAGKIPEEALEVGKEETRKLSRRTAELAGGYRKRSRK